MRRRLLSIRHTEETLDVGRTKVYELVANGDLELVKIGRKSLITADSIERLVAKLSKAAP